MPPHELQEEAEGDGRESAPHSGHGCRRGRAWRTALETSAGSALGSKARLPILDLDDPEDADLGETLLSGVKKDDEGRFSAGWPPPVPVAVIPAQLCLFVWLVG